MKKNTYVYVKNRLEISTKTMFKGKDVGTLYCILGEEIFVMQGLSIIEVGMEQLAEGLAIDLFEAQKILAGDYREESLSVLEKADEVKEKLEGAVTSKKESLEEKVADAKEDVTEQIPSIPEIPSIPSLNLPDNELIQRVTKLELLVDVLCSTLGLDKDDVLNMDVSVETPIENIEEPTIENQE